MLSLYDRDGKTLLASNDDGDSGLASRIDWVAPKSGTYFFKVSAFDKTLTGNFRVSLKANSTHAAGIQSVSVTTDAAPSLGPIINPTAGVSFVQTTTLGNRLTAGPFNYDASAVNGARFAVQSFDATPAIMSGNLLEGTSPLSRTDTITPAADRTENERVDSLLDRHPGLRTVLSSMLLDDESAVVEPVKSLELDLDALDALFAQLAENDFGGNG